MANLYLLCGFLGAGKTTFAQTLAKKNNAAILNADQWCQKMFLPEDYEQNWEKCFSATITYLWRLTEEYAVKDVDVVLDWGFWNRQERQLAIKQAKRLAMTPIIYYLYAPDHILKQRISCREGKIAEHNLQNFDTIKQLFEEPTADEDFIKIDNF